MENSENYLRKHSLLLLVLNEVILIQS